MSADDTPPGPVNRHAPTPMEMQAMQLAKLLKDPSKDVFIPKPAKEKSLRPPREMMKNVQGSSAGAGSGEFHVYKQNRRREYERIKLMNEHAEKEAEAEAFQQRMKEREEAADSKTAKNRAKRQKKKARAKTGPKTTGDSEAGPSQTSDQGPTKKRRLVDGQAMVFRRPGEESDDDDDDGPGPQPRSEHEPGLNTVADGDDADETQVRVIEEQKIIIHDD